MTENMIAPATDAGEAEGGKKKLAFLAGGLAGLLALGGGGYMLLSGGSAAEEDAYAPVKRAPRTAAPAKATTKTVTSKAVTTKVPAASTVRIGRDPFKALYLVPEVSTVPVTAPAEPAKTTTGTEATSNLPYSIALTKVTTDKGGAKLFTFAIGKESKTVLPAQRFGKYGELVVLTYLTNSKNAVIGAVLQVGDDDPIDIAIGSKLTVQ